MTSDFGWGPATGKAQGESTVDNLACGAMTVTFWLGFLPFLDPVGGLVAVLCNATTSHSRNSYGGQFTHRLNDGGTEAKRLDVGDDMDDHVDCWQLWTLDFLDATHVPADRQLLPRLYSAGALLSFQRCHAKQTNAAVSGGMPAQGSSFRRLAARHEQYLAYAVAVATLQLFLRLARANVTTLFLPMLSQATGCRRSAARIGDAVLVLANAGGVLGSALATRQYGREAMCAISQALVVVCQVAVPAIVGAHAGLSGGTRMAMGQGAAMFAVACAVSGGFGWSWGALFWAVPGEGIRSVGQAAGAALGFGLGFAQVHCFLLTLRQLKHAAVAYYAVWIWS